MWDKSITYDSTMDAYWQTQLFAPDTIEVAAAASNLRGSILSVTFTRQVATGHDEDKAVVSFHFAVRPGTQGLYTFLDASDAQVVEDSFATKMFTPRLSTLMSNQWNLDEYIWRNFGADNPLDNNGISKPGPVWRARAVTTVGANAGTRLPDQDAMTTTYKTCSRKHWGRNYWGGFTTTSLNNTAFGHWLPASCDTIAQGCRDWFQDLWDNPRMIEAVVWSAKYRGIMSIDEVQVDDVVDIVRRRRAKTAVYKRIYTS